MTLAFKNTLIFIGICVPLIMAVAFLLASGLRKAARLKGFLALAFMLPLVIRVDFLEQAVLAEIRRFTQFASRHEAAFAKMMMGFSKQTVESEHEEKQKKLAAMRTRDRELDKLFNKMYEDNVAGKIDDDRFARMSKQYTDEQKMLSEAMRTIAELDSNSEKTMTVDMFTSTVRKYTRAKKLTERMVFE